MSPLSRRDTLLAALLVGLVVLAGLWATGALSGRESLTLATTTEPESIRRVPQTAPNNVALRIKMGMKAGANSDPSARVTQERCQRPKATLDHSNTCVLLKPPFLKDAHSAPRKNPSSVIIAPITVETAIRAIFFAAFGQSTSAT